MKEMPETAVQGYLKEMTETAESVYPKELIEKCQSRKNYIYRKGSRKDAVTQEGAKLTLLETENPKAYEFYDIFEVQRFDYSPENGEVNLNIQISLLEKVKEIEITPLLVDLEKEKVLKKFQPDKAEDTQRMVIEHNFTVKSSDQVGRMGLVAYAKWGNNQPQEYEVTLLKEANTGQQEVFYDHKYPKKEKETVILGNLESGTHKKEEAGDTEHIVIALIRRPDNLKDVDYVCGYGRDKSGHPNVCVPGEGTVTFAAGEYPASDEKHVNRAVCRLYRKDGGAAVIAQSDDPAYTGDKMITIVPTGNGYHYSFVSWDTGYKDPGAFQKTEFDYYLQMTLYTKGMDGTWNEYDLAIDTREGCESLENLSSLELMYGCMAPETKIRMADGSDKEIRFIRIGEKVRGKGGQNMAVKNVWRGPEPGGMVQMFIQGIPEGLLLTRSHPVWVREEDGTEKWKRAGACTIKDKVLAEERGTAAGESYRKIERIMEREACEEVFNLDLMPVQNANAKETCGGSMFSGGILTGDNQIQNGYPEE